MDRRISYPLALQRLEDALGFQRDAIYALGALIEATVGTGPAVSGLAAAPTTPASMSISVGMGSIYSLQPVDSSAYGVLGVDNTVTMKQGLSGPQTLTLTAPGTAGYSQIYLVQAAYLDADDGATVLPYYNSANPSQPFSGPGNSGATQYTVRKGKLILSLKPGAAAPTGSQIAPAADANAVALYAITVSNGTTQITAGMINVATGAPFLDTKLANLRKAIRNQADNYCTNTGTANALAVTIRPTPGSWSELTGVPIRIKIGAANTDAVTLAVAGIAGTATVVTPKGNALASGDLAAGSIATLIYDGTRFVLTGLVLSDFNATGGYVAPIVTTFYVNSATGNDANSGTSAGSAFATLQGAVNKICGTYISQGVITINVAAGTYRGALIGSSYINVLRFVFDPAAIVDCTTTAYNGGRCLVAAHGSNVETEGGTFRGYYEALAATEGGRLSAHNPTLYGSLQSTVGTVAAYGGSYLFIYGNISVYGGGHVFVSSSQSAFVCVGYKDENVTYACSMTFNNCAFTSVFAAGDAGTITVNSAVTSFYGAVTGQRYWIATNGAINTQGAGANYLPGSTAGVTGTGGQYV